ncbi:MAG: PDZ domain-containing protein [Polyangiaceae bacterium]|nr:PDZ domain-containing protein [Polyangiaceae bacterium]
MRRAALAAWFALGLTACGGAAPPPAVEADQPFDEEGQPRPERVVRQLERRDVDAAVAGGLGRFLGRVQLEPELDGQRFVGFRIVELRPFEWWEGVDLQPGDIVLRVNGQPIGRDTEAHAAFESLRTASELRVTLLRDGRRRELVLPIVGAPAPKSAPPVASAAAPGASSAPAGSSPPPPPPAPASSAR